MSIQVQDLTKVYGKQRALDGISFSIAQGEIVGFLGPNGAGKSTTMKILTGYLPPSGGKALVEGLDVTERPLDVKRQTGYLPEHNPLYQDMYVHEYLKFVAGLYRNSTGQRVKEMIHLCGLTLEQNKKIGALSKGYRQRVGLAQALIHDPKVLILDEPTSGLDPNQLVEIRKLIKEVSRDKTVLFSTHILQEVEALCDRVMVINKGTIVADDQLSNLRQSGSGALVVAFGQPVDQEELKSIPGIASVENIDKHKFRLRAVQGADIRSAVVTFSAQGNRPLLELRQEENSLESIFSQLTQPTSTKD